MDNFFVDKLGNDVGEEENCGKRNAFENSTDDEDEFLNIEDIDLVDEELGKRKWKETSTKKKNNFSLDDTYLITSYKYLNEEVINYSEVDKVLEKSVIKPGLEKQIRVPPEKGKKLLKLERQKLRKKTKGKEWFNMPAPQRTKEIMNDFKLLKMRSVLDRKHVYKKNDITNVPKYFQIGKIVEGPADFYSGRIPKSQRKKTFVDELLADAEFQKYQKKKFKEIMDESRRKKHVKKNKMKNKKGKSKTPIKEVDLRPIKHQKD